MFGLERKRSRETEMKMEIMSGSGLEEARERLSGKERDRGLERKRRRVRRQR